MLVYLRNVVQRESSIVRESIEQSGIVFNMKSVFYFQALQIDELFFCFALDRNFFFCIGFLNVKLIQTISEWACFLYWSFPCFVWGLCLDVILIYLLVAHSSWEVLWTLWFEKLLNLDECYLSLFVECPKFHKLINLQSWKGHILLVISYPH